MTNESKNNGLTKEELEARGMRRLFEHWFGDQAEHVAKEMLSTPPDLVNREDYRLADVEFESLRHSVLARAEQLRTDALSAAVGTPRARIPTADIIGRAKHAFGEVWHSLTSFTPLVPTGQTLGYGMAMEPYGVEADLAKIFDVDTLVRDLPWAKGPIQIVCTLNDSGSINALVAQIPITPGQASEGGAVRLRFEDIDGNDAFLELTQSRPSRAINNLALRGAFSDLRMAVDIAKAQ